VRYDRYLCFRQEERGFACPHPAPSKNHHVLTGEIVHEGDHLHEIWQGTLIKMLEHRPFLFHRVRWLPGPARHLVDRWTGAGRTLFRR